MTTIKELRDLLDNATPGEWKILSDEFGGFDGRFHGIIAGPAKLDGYSYGQSEAWDRQDMKTAGIMLSDARLISASRNTLPTLLDLIEEMAEAFRHIETLRERADALVGVVDRPHHKALNIAVKRAQSALAAYEKMKGK